MDINEIKYNTNALVSTWLDKKDDIKRVWIELVDDDYEITDTVETTKESCGDKIADILCNNYGRYGLLKLYGGNGETKELLGIMDIL